MKLGRRHPRCRTGRKTPKWPAPSLQLAPPFTTVGLFVAALPGGKQPKKQIASRWASREACPAAIRHSELKPRAPYCRYDTCPGGSRQMKGQHMAGILTMLMLPDLVVSLDACVVEPVG